MPRLSVWFVRFSLIHLFLGFTIGGLILANKGIPFAPWVWNLLARSHGIPAPRLDGSAGNGRRLLDSATLQVKSAAWKCQSYMGHPCIIERGNCNGCDSTAHQHELACFGGSLFGNIQCVALCACFVAKSQTDGSVIRINIKFDGLKTRCKPIFSSNDYKLLNSCADSIRDFGHTGKMRGVESLYA